MNTNYVVLTSFLFNWVIGEFVGWWSEQIKRFT